MQNLFFSEETLLYLDEITTWLSECLHGKEDFMYSGFVNNVLIYGSILTLLWLMGCSPISSVSSVIVLTGYGLLLGITLKIIFALGFNGREILHSVLKLVKNKS